MGVGNKPESQIETGPPWLRSPSAAQGCGGGEGRARNRKGARTKAHEAHSPVHNWSSGLQAHPPLHSHKIQGQPKHQPKPGRGPHCHMALVSLPSPRKSDVLLTTMLAAMTSGSTQIDSTKKVYSKDGRSREGRDRTTDMMMSDLHFLPGSPRAPVARLTKLECHVAKGGVTMSWALPLQPWEASSRRRGDYASLSNHSATLCPMLTNTGRLQKESPCIQICNGSARKGCPEDLTL